MTVSLLLVWFCSFYSGKLEVASLEITADPDEPVEVRAGVLVDPKEEIVDFMSVTSVALMLLFILISVR